ncbi:hypothetical protein EVAR_66298_1 [Eumeta japonica]|uniref:Uncharacterized protein n=1 Tax=Eumeta variegata TaxID=151549 RepID=A0A4C1YV63_EUMVA|nr:hypothetical protein EVAR_66298_1 [Eumeta japonica]
MAYGILMARHTHRRARPARRPHTPPMRIGLGRHARTDAVIATISDKRGCKSPESRWPSPPMHICNPKGVTSVLPASCIEIEYLIEKDC